MPQSQFATRNQSSGLMGMLQQLLGREGQPNLPEVEEMPMTDMLAAQDAALQGGDIERLRTLRSLISDRNPVQQQGLTSAANAEPRQNAAMQMQRPQGIFELLQAANPGEVVGNAMEEARRRGGY